MALDIVSRGLASRALSGQITAPAGTTPTITSGGSTFRFDAAAGNSADLNIRTGNAGADNANATVSFRANSGTVGYLGRVSTRFGIFDAAGAILLTWGTGSPESAVTASVGALFLRTDGGANTTLYVKESGSATNTGWVAK